MALTQYYVDPAINANSGTGTSGDPFGDLQYALNTITRNATNGDQINIKAGTAEVLAAVLSFASYGTTASADAPLVLRGYTSAANDGGVATIDAGGNKIVDESAFDCMVCCDLVFTNAGSNTMLRLGGWCSVVRCQFTNGTGRAVWVGGTQGPTVIACYLAVVSNAAITTGYDAVVRYSYLVGSTVYSSASSSAGVTLDSNIIVPYSNNNGVSVYGEARIMNNIIRAPGASTGAGILVSADSEHCVIANNVIVNFSGAGGVGLSIASGGRVVLAGHNAYYNNTSNVVDGGVLLIDETAADVALSADPFTDAANGDFSLTATAKTALRSLGWPASYPGAHANTDPHVTIGPIQYGPAEAGGGVVRRVMRLIGG